MSSWYKKLREYFPEKEMKTKEHFELLLKEKKGLYQIIDDMEYILVYFEKLDYIFIDYILVKGTTRGKGIGSMVLNELKKRGKTIILEVEPVTIQDPDSERRIRFYERNNFKKIDSIRYERIHNITNELNQMDIYCWSEAPVSDAWVLNRMADAYLEVHCFGVKEIYGRDPQPVEEVIWFEDSKARTDVSKVIV
nr:GNAT family N-acetyltransferase [Lysinibacillus timonensis]